MRIPDHLTVRHCSDCGQTTKQRDLWCKRSPTSDGPLTSYSWHMFHAIECVRCGVISFVDRLWVHPGPMMGDATVENEDFWPPQPFRKIPDWVSTLTQSQQDLLKEVYVAADHHLFTVATMGLRSVIDLALSDLVGDIGGFEQKLKNAISNNLINSKFQEPLAAVIDAGHAASHRGHMHDANSFDLLISMIERLLHRIYVATKEEQELQHQAALLRSSTPQRTKP